MMVLATEDPEVTERKREETEKAQKHQSEKVGKSPVFTFPSLLFSVFLCDLGGFISWFLPGC